MRQSSIRKCVAGSIPVDRSDINTSLAQAQTQIHIHANYFSLPPRLEEKTKANGAAKTISPIKGDRRQLEAKRFREPKAAPLQRNVPAEEWCWIDRRHTTHCGNVFKGVQGVKQVWKQLLHLELSDVAERYHQDTRSENERLLGCTLDKRLPPEPFYTKCTLCRLKELHRWNKASTVTLDLVETTDRSGAKIFSFFKMWTERVMRCGYRPFSPQLRKSMSSIKNEIKRSCWHKNYKTKHEDNNLVLTGIFFVHSIKMPALKEVNHVVTFELTAHKFTTSVYLLGWKDFP